MKNSIAINRTNYGGGFVTHAWTLVCSVGDKQFRFYLGQDVKFCERSLGMSCAAVAEAIGTREIDEGTPGNELLANHIVEHLNLQEEDLPKLDTWSFSAE